MGLIRPSDLGVRGALVADIIPPKHLVGAISVSRTTMDTARIAGALSGTGLFAVLGIGPAYVAIVCLYLTAMVLTLCVSPPAKALAIDDATGDLLARSPLRDLKEGVAYVWNSPRMRAALWVAFLANVTAYPITNGLLPYVARDILQTHQTGLGYISASFAFGSLIGSVTLSVASGVRAARLLIGATVTWYAMLLIFAEIRSLPAAVVCLMLMGIAQSMSMISIAVILMRTAAERFRGRVMGVRMMVINGLPLGLLAAGSLIDLIGYPATAMLYAASGLAFMLAIAVRWREDLWPAHAPANAR
jgi:predicted MFS family arabinose efflux permease